MLQMSKEEGSDRRQEQEDSKRCRMFEIDLSIYLSEQQSIVA
jgi:hypothetical protein